MGSEMCIRDRKEHKSDLTKFGLVAYVLGARKRGVSIDLYESIQCFTAMEMKRELPLFLTLFFSSTLEIHSAFK